MIDQTPRNLEGICPHHDKVNMATPPQIPEVLNDPGPCQKMRGFHVPIFLLVSIRSQFSFPESRHFPDIRHAADIHSRFYQRGCWTYRLSEKKQDEFRIAMLDFLHEVDKKAKDAILPFEEKLEQPGQLTAGISMFYFEEKPGD